MTPAPLDGLRIVDCSTFVAGPSAGMTLAQLGADVIRVDPPLGAPDTRRWPLDAAGNSLYFVGLNKAKRSVTIDTRSEAGRELLLDLVSAPGDGGGILLTNLTGAAWLDYEVLRARRADVIVVHVLGRPDGSPAVDYTVNAAVGVPWFTGPAHEAGPINQVLPAWDLLAGLHAALAILVAERVRAATGAGQLVRLALSDVAVATVAHLGMVAEVAINGRGRRREGNFVYGTFGADFETGDGERVMVVALTGRQWRALQAATGTAAAIQVLADALEADFDDDGARYRYREVLAALMRPWFARHRLEEVGAALESAGALWGAYGTIDELVHDPASLLRAGDLMVDVEQPGIGTFPVPRPVASFGAWAAPTPRPAPRLGEDTDDVLAELLGLEADAIEVLRAAGTIGPRPAPGGPAAR